MAGGVPLSPSLEKVDGPLDKDAKEPEAFEVVKEGQSQASPSSDESDVYQFLVSYQESHAGRLVLDPR